MPESFHVQAGNLSLCVETRGDPDGEPVIFVMGLGAQMTLWPEALLDHYADEGFRVIRFDNRDIGLSSHLKDRLEGHPVAVMARHRMGLPIAAPYTLHDMAGDVCHLMDALGLASAHLVGVSMGGMISQLVAANHPERVRSATLIMTSTNSPRLPMPETRLIWRLAGIGARGHDEASVVARSLDFWKAIQSPGFPPGEQAVKDRVVRDYRRSYHPAGILRQTRAILATGSLSSATRRIRVPVSVIHGKDDPLVRPVAAEQLGYLMPHARIEMIQGMGHDLPEPLLPHFAAIGFETMAKTLRMDK
ncbi:alpha/beta hydrolase [Marinobacter sp. TBZ242]|uniref:Alpha/beta hydrolase n=1 Tax=Marinobacter azerbaijanicus TaxID=3050455 RepID=A0ABT7ICV4_9GAMM|nr:alpha/beta hydrolase [Marinobacter sp. TBZ242]MDL0431977.1 alpha/beta hydrolase [Marinobacter sp. TBZ242]